MRKKRVIGDPYLRDRVIFSDEGSSLKKWVIIFSLLGLASVAGIGSLYFPEFTLKVKNYLKMVISTDQSENKDSSLPPSDEIPPSDSNEIEASEVSESQAEITESIAIPPQSESADIAESKSTHSEENNMDISTQESSNDSALESQMETVPEESTETSIETTAFDSTQIPTSADVEKLLTTAERQIRQLRFTTPEGNNAYETYQTLVKIAPDKAAPILDEIVAWYSERGERLLKRDRILRPAQKNAYEMYEKMQAIAPQHPHSKALLENLLSALEEQANQQIDREKLIRPKGDNAQETYQAMLAIAPHHTKTQEISDTILAPLFEKAEQQIQKRQLTTPKNDSAANTYQEILDMFPDNERAKVGLKEIADEYYALAVGKQQQGEYSDSLLMIERGLEIMPENSDLLTLKEEINTYLQNGR